MLSSVGIFVSQFESFLPLLAGIALMTLLAHVTLFLTINRLRSQKNQIVRDKNKESDALVKHRDQLHARTRSYEESLSYAQRIQKAVSLTPTELSSYFEDSFIYQKPKDIVSGDFNWARKIGSKLLFSVADCTGHGVPGAFMSLIGLEFFRQITQGKGVSDPADILNEMSVLFNTVFDDHGDPGLKDGMDLALCAYDREEGILEFAGAFSSIYLVRNQEIIQFKGDKIFMGPDNGLQRGQYTNQRIRIENDDIIYMFTDGYPDQFGGPEGKKFKYRRFRHLVMSVHKLEMQEQARVLETQMKEWMGSTHEQIDDQTIIGLRPASYSFS